MSVAKVFCPISVLMNRLLMKSTQSFPPWPTLHARRAAPPSNKQNTLTFIRLARISGTTPRVDSSSEIRSSIVSRPFCASPAHRTPTRSLSKAHTRCMSEHTMLPVTEPTGNTPFSTARTPWRSPRRSTRATPSACPGCRRCAPFLRSPRSRTLCLSRPTPTPTRTPDSAATRALRLTPRPHAHAPR